MPTDFLESINVYKHDNKYSLHKPLLLLIALHNCLNKEPRLTLFSRYEALQKKWFSDLDQCDFSYSFGRLVNDGIWEVEGLSHIRKSSSGDLYRSDLKNQNTKGGLEEKLHAKLSHNQSHLLNLMHKIIETYLPQEHQKKIIKLMDIESHTLNQVKEISYITSYRPSLQIPLTLQGKETMQSEYISYLNSLHNVSASNTNALAEAQALHPHFAELYAPFPVAEPLLNLLNDSQDRVVILTGHAGDGKSTIALDILKRLRGYSSQDTLGKPLKEKEVCSLPSGQSIHIVKDMSELEKEKRLEWLEQGFHEAGSWLIVSNTGPMLTSLAAFTPDHVSVENDVLRVLDDTFLDKDFDNLTIHEIDGHQLAKPLVIVNVARLDNTKLGATLLEKMIGHSGWEECNACSSKPKCPLRKNRDALIESTPELTDRIRWVYQRLTAYDQRLTLRQMVGHLALSLTGNMQCQEAQRFAQSQEPDQGLAKILFSETFFGYRVGKKSSLITGVKAAELLQCMELGGNIAADFERQLIRNVEQRNYVLPTSLTRLDSLWVKKSQGNYDGIHLRHALRRMAYTFGRPSPSRGCEPKFDMFLNQFLHSAYLRSLDAWVQGDWNKLGYSAHQKIRKNILIVLLEIYSGFSAAQFDDKEQLYLTLARKDQDTSQPTQIIVAEISYDDFFIDFDLVSNLPKLIYRPNKNIYLLLNLPLLDFIHSRGIGSSGNSLPPIHIAKLEWFRSSLLMNSHNHSHSEKIVFLKSTIEGLIETKKYHINKERTLMEKG